MSTDFPGSVSILDTGGKHIGLQLDGDAANIKLGGHPDLSGGQVIKPGTDGALYLNDKQDHTRIHLGIEDPPKGQSSGWCLTLRDPAAATMAKIGPGAEVALGGSGYDGLLTIRNAVGNVRVLAGANKGVYVIQVGTGNAGHFEITNSNNPNNAALLGKTSGIGNGVAGHGDHDSVSGVYGENSAKRGHGVTGKNTSHNNTFGSLGSTVLAPAGIYPGFPPGTGVPDGMPTGVHGHTGDIGGCGVVGTSNAWGTAVNPDQGTGVFGYSERGVGVAGGTGFDGGCGILGWCHQPGGYAGYFKGEVGVPDIFWAVSKQFKIDHPLDPSGKYLVHSSVESPERLNVYDGIVTLDRSGDAWVSLPQWFEALNRDMRYQLTAVGAPAPDLHVSEEVKDNRFKIAGGHPGMKVSWQVTGVRQDVFAKAHPLKVEVVKEGSDRGTYLNPVEHGQSAEAGVRPFIAARGR